MSFASVSRTVSRRMQEHRRGMFVALVISEVFCYNNSNGVINVDALREIWNAFDFTYILKLISSVVPSLICISVHETCHGLAAYALGDDTAKSQGRLTMNPIRHIDVTGLLMMMLFHVGWAKPVPVNMMKFKNPKRGMAVTALAGPASNVLLAVVFIFIYGALYLPLKASAVGAYILDMILVGSYISIGLAVFNLIPVPPLDGSKILFSFLSNRTYYKLMRYERYFSLIMIVLVATGIIGRPLSSAISSVYDFFTPVADFSYRLVRNLFYR